MVDSNRKALYCLFLTAETPNIIQYCIHHSTLIQYLIVRFCTHFSFAYSFIPRNRTHCKIVFKSMFFKNEGFYRTTCIIFCELRYERFSGIVFPGASSFIEMMWLRSDFFYRSNFIRETSVSTKQNDDLLKELR